MKRVKLAAATLNQTPLDWEGNLANILEAIELAKQAGASLLCLPELCISGYGCEDSFLSPGVQQEAIEVLAEIAPACKGIAVSVGLPLLFNGALFDAACLITDGQIIGFSAKRYLASSGIHYEPRWFKPWPSGVQDSIRLFGRRFPVGDLVFQCGDVGIAFEICEDAWVAKRPGSVLVSEGVDIILNPSASHFAFGKHEVRKRFVLEGSRAFSVAYVYSNLMGNEAGRIIYDGGSLIATAGQLVAAGPRFSFQPITLATAVIDIDLLRMQKAQDGNYQPRLGNHANNRVVSEFELPPAQPEVAKTEIASWELGPNVKEEEFARAVSLGLFDYMRKTRSRGFVVSLSGGADSSATSCLVWLMVEFGCQELGLEGFKRRLDYIPEVQSAQSTREIVSALLHCVYQATRNSSQATRNAAETVAKAIGARFSIVEVDDLVESYVRKVEQIVGRKLTWDRDDIALQNIQARARGPTVWLLANVRGSLLLSTSNRSEAAVGYATMDGDTCGGLCPIAGIDKAYLRRWLYWLQTQGPSGLRPLPELQAVTQLAPTAELRPQEQHQTDEDDLMPYEVLDRIERAAIRDKLPPVEVFELLRLQFPQYTPQQLHIWVKRFFQLWCRNQWKRERYAPSFHLDDENLDPKTWCRFPIISGGFKRELDKLDRHASQHLKAGETSSDI